jgi:hypothetical protein
VNFFFLFASDVILFFLGSLFVFEVEKTFSYLPFFYSLGAIFSLFFLLILGLWRMVSWPSMEKVARGLEEKFPNLKDDITNSLLLFNQIKEGSSLGRISETLISAQLKKTSEEVKTIKPKQVVSFRGTLRYLRLFFPLFLAFLLVLFISPHFLNRSLALILHPFSNLPIRETRLFLEPTGSMVLRGTEVVINAKVTGNVPEKVTLTIWPDGREDVHFPMESDGEGKFFYKVGSVQVSFRYQAHSGRVTSPVYSIRVVDPPEVEKMRLTLIPPDYTGLPKEVKEQGAIEALKGTIVNLEVWASKKVKEGKIVLDQGSQLPLKNEGALLKGTLLIFYPCIYSIKLKDHLDFENPNSSQYQIRLIPDKNPEAEIMSPTDDLDIVGNEVIPIVYTVKDDFGISEVKLSYQMGGITRWINLKSKHLGRTIGPEIVKWDLKSLDLIGGDKVVYRLEVWDNDSISGPKAGYSRSFSLSVRDERNRAAKEGEEAQQIANALLDLLADQLEDARGGDKETLTRRMEEILHRVDRNLEQMGEKVERLDFEALKRNLSSLKERVSEAQKETVTQEMERLALLSEEIAKKAKMNEVEAMAREIRNRQKRLIDSLGNLKDHLTREGLEAVLKELKQLEDLLHSVMEALSKFASKLPDEFINSEDLKGMDVQDLFKDLQEIRNRMLAGDLSGALEMAQRLLHALSEMMAALGRAGAQAGMAPFDRLQGEMSHQSGELAKILTEQKEILGGTEKMDRDIRTWMEEEIKKRFALSLPPFKEALDELGRLLPPEQKDWVEEIERLFNGGNLERLSQLMKGLEKDATMSSKAQNLIQELRKMTEDIHPDFKEKLTPNERERFTDLSLRQDHLMERTKKVKEKLEMLAQLFPGMDTEILNDFREAAGSMGEAYKKLREENAPGAIPPEQEALRRLTKSQQGMQQMAQQMATRMQAARWGYPLAYDPRPGWYYGPWIPMPTLPQPEFKRPLERGYTGIDKEEFELPSKDAYKAPKIFREKILESLKEGIPSHYKREVEKYFRSLTE